MATTTARPGADDPQLDDEDPRQPLSFGDGIDNRLQAVGEWTEFAGGAIRGVAGSPRYISEVLRQTAILVRGTSVLMFILNVSLGLAICSVGFFILRSVGATGFIGLIVGYGIPHQMATTGFGYVIAAKVCCGFAAEVGAMKIQQEIDALEQTGVDSMRYVVGTRIAATLLYTPIATAIVLIAQTIGSWFAASVILNGVPANTLLDISWSMQTPSNQFLVLVTNFAIATTCAITACFFGMRASGGPASVGKVAAASLLVNLMLVHLLAAGLAVVFYGSELDLPIGG